MLKFELSDKWTIVFCFKRVINSSKIGTLEKQFIVSGLGAGLVKNLRCSAILMKPNDQQFTKNLCYFPPKSHFTSVLSHCSFSWNRSLQRSLTHSPALLQLAFYWSKAKVLPVRIRTQVSGSVILRSTTRAASGALKFST